MFSPWFPVKVDSTDIFDEKGMPRRESMATYGIGFIRTKPLQRVGPLEQGRGQGCMVIYLVVMVHAYLIPCM